MTRRDATWRGTGIALIVLGGGVGIVAQAMVDAASDPAWLGLLGLSGLICAIAGLVLAVQGKRVPLAFRIEQSRHRDLPLVVHHRIHRDRVLARALRQGGTPR